MKYEIYNAFLHQCHGLGLRSRSLRQEKESAFAAQGLIDGAFEITEISPESGRPGEVLTLTGTNFIDGMSVTIDGTAYTATYVCDTEATIVVPYVEDAESVEIAATSSDEGDTLEFEYTSGTGDSYSDCTSDGDVGCITTSAYKSAKAANANAADIKAGVTIAGVTGTAVIESHDDCAADAEVGCVTTNAFKAADMTVAIASNIGTGVTIAGAVGAGGPEGHSNCTADGIVGCATTAGFKSADMTYVTAGNIKSGVTIGGVSGDFPSATYTLTGASGTADLEAASFDNKAKSATAFEYWNSAGVRQTGAGDADITAANIFDGVTVFGTLGTYAPACTSDGQTACATTSRYKSVDTNPLTVWDIRMGKTAGGIAGSLTYYRNMADTGGFNRVAGSGSLAGVDPYDTQDDFNFGGAFPTENPTGWDQALAASWLREATSDNGAGGGVASDGLCNGTETCIFTDRLTNLSWLKPGTSNDSWENAITSCDGSSAGGFTDWRLATQKEAMQAYTNGIFSLKAATKLGVTANNYWTATNTSSDTNNAWYGSVGTGAFGNADKTLANVARIFCVR